MTRSLKWTSPGRSTGTPISSRFSRKEKRHEDRELASPDLADTLAMTFAVSLVLVRREQHEEWFKDLLRYRLRGPSEHSWMQ